MHLVNLYLYFKLYHLQQKISNVQYTASYTLTALVYILANANVTVAEDVCPDVSTISGHFNKWILYLCSSIINFPCHCSV